MIVIYAVFMLVLTALSWYIAPKLNVYDEEEVSFGQEYAAELLLLIDSIEAGAGQMGNVSKTKLCDYYLDGQDKFRDLKSAATHMKGEQGEDFVYALALAEDWCRNAAEAAFHPDNTKAKTTALERYRQAKAELAQIKVKEYKRKQ
jgi:hypothetical protein